MATAGEDDSDGIFAGIFRKQTSIGVLSRRLGSMSRSRSRPSSMVRLALGGST
jgi:hypothetical protein